MNTISYSAMSYPLSHPFLDIFPLPGYRGFSHDLVGPKSINPNLNLADARLMKYRRRSFGLTGVLEKGVVS